MYVVSILLLLNEQKYNLFSEPYSAIFTYHKYVLTLQATTSFEIWTNSACQYSTCILVYETQLPKYYKWVY